MKVIEKYRSLNKLPLSLYGIKKWHPNLDLDYFKNIDSREKAYWLGWLYAESWLSMHSEYVRFGVEIHKEDEINLLDKFANSIGFNIKYKESKIFREGELTNHVRIKFVNEIFTHNLINHGLIVGKNKSKSIELPKLNSREIYLAFFLGYYDGDGKVGTSIITSGSINFIRQIKDHFNIPRKIWRTDSEWGGVGYNIYLGMNLMREMLKNYEDSLPRKRQHFKLH